jgi:hypothetical protein
VEITPEQAQNKNRMMKKKNVKEKNNFESKIY